MLSKKEKKRLYDIEYRRANKEKIKQRTIKYNESPAGRAMQKRARDKRKKEHLKYCQTDEYRKYKHKYDMEYRYKRVYGEFWECMQLCVIIDKKVRELIPSPYIRRKLRGYYEHFNAKKRLKRMLGLK